MRVEQDAHFGEKSGTGHVQGSPCRIIHAGKNLSVTSRSQVHTDITGSARYWRLPVSHPDWRLQQQSSIKGTPSKRAGVMQLLASLDCTPGMSQGVPGGSRGCRIGWLYCIMDGMR